MSTTAMWLLLAVVVIVIVFAEKPSVARDIARVLGCSKKENGALEGNKYDKSLC